MKSLLIVLATLTSLNSFAVAYECIENNHGVTHPHTLTLTQIGNSYIREGQPYRFILVLKDAQGNILANEIAKITTEDVMVQFRVTGKPVRGMMYADEMDASWVRFNGADLQLDCQVTEE